MKILHVLDRSVPDLSGYSIRSKYILEFQKKIGLEPTVITSPKYTAPTVSSEVINGITYYRSKVSSNKFNNSILKIPFLKEKLIVSTLSNDIISLCEKEKFDIIHAHSPSLCAMAAIGAAHKLRIPVLYEVRALWEDAAVDQGKFREGSLKYRMSRFLETSVFKKADGLTVICQGLKEEIAKRGCKNIHVIPNGVDSNYFTPRPKNFEIIRKHNLENKIVLGFFGSFFKFEGLDTLIKAMAKIKEKRSDIVLLILGGGLEDKNVRSLAAKLEVVDKNVFFTGKVPHEQILDYYATADILIYPRISLRITELVTPLKPLEAMSMERAVIASDVGGLKELVKDNETGILFKAGNVDDLAEKILLLANDAEKRRQLGLAGRKDVVANRDWGNIIPKYLDIYEEVTKKHATR